MKRTLQNILLSRNRGNIAALAQGMGWGVIGGLAGTMIMDFLLSGVLWIVGMPALLCFSMVGDTVARFFTIMGIEMAGGIPTGAAAHYLIGPLVGAIFGAGVTRMGVRQPKMLKTYILFAVLYVSILSQPLLAMTPILLKMKASEILLWYGGSFVMHFVLAVVLGVVVGYGLRLHTAARNKYVIRALQTTVRTVSPFHTVRKETGENRDLH